MPINPAITNQPGVYSQFTDGNVNKPFVNVRPPRIVLMGTAENGADYFPTIYNDSNIDQMSKIFKTTGTLVRQSQEMQSHGERSCYAVRICSRSPFAMHIGATNSGPTSQEDGYFISSVFGGIEQGTRLGIAYDSVTKRLIVIDKSSTTVVFDNSSTSPVDLGLVIVRGAAGAQGTSIGTIVPSAPATSTVVSLGNQSALQAIDSAVIAYAGDNGVNPSRMKLYEGFIRGLAAMEGFPSQYIAAPTRATLDAPFKADFAALAAVGTAYPTANSTTDYLGKVFVEFVDDRYEFYWDVDGDGVAEYWSVEDTSGYSLISKNNSTFAASSFLEPNFAYALAYHCHKSTIESGFVQGIIGVEPPQFGKTLSNWLGKKPIFSTALDGTVTVGTNGTGLLGNKYMAGKIGFRNSLAYGGFIETAVPYFDSGIEAKDVNDRPIDLGKYISIWVTQEAFTPSLGVNDNQIYASISPAAYASFRASLGPLVTPSNKVYLANGGFNTYLLRSNVSDLIEMRYTMAKQDLTGIKIVDAPSAARPDSDYLRQGTIEILQFVENALRLVANRFIGRNMAAEEEAALQKELDEAMNGLSASRVIRGGLATLRITRQDRILGRAKVNVIVIVPFELRSVVFTIALSEGSNQVSGQNNI